MTRRITEETREQIRADRKTGKTFVELAKKYHVGKDVIREAVRGIPYSRTEQMRLIAARIKSDRYTDEMIADDACCSVEFVRERRAVLDEASKTLRRSAGYVAADNIDTGKRISESWLRRHCSKGERTLFQIQAIFGPAFTIRDIITSCHAAGLPVNVTSGLVGVQPVELPTREPVYERRIKVGFLNYRRRKIH